MLSEQRAGFIHVINYTKRGTPFLNVQFFAPIVRQQDSDQGGQTERAEFFFCLQSPRFGKKAENDDDDVEDGELDGGGDASLEGSLDDTRTKNQIMWTDPVHPVTQEDYESWKDSSIRLTTLNNTSLSGRPNGPPLPFENEYAVCAVVFFVLAAPSQSFFGQICQRQDHVEIAVHSEPAQLFRKQKALLRATDASYFQEKAAEQSSCVFRGVSQEANETGLFPLLFRQPFYICIAFNSILCAESYERSFGQFYP